MTALAVLLSLGAPAVFLGACEDPYESMREQPRYDPYEPSDLFDNGTSARPPVEGTISRDDWINNAPFHTGMAGNQLLDEIPAEVTAELLERGRERFNIFCTPCHGYDGYGQGMIVQRGYTQPPSFHTERLRTIPEGHLFRVITNGFGRMPSYAAQVPTEDRWAIIAYIRALQLSQHAPTGEAAAATATPGARPKQEAP